MAKKGTKFKKYSPEFKISCIMDIRNNHLGYNEAERKYNIAHSVLIKWERIFLEEGEVGLHKERRGRTIKMRNPKIGRPRKILNKKVKQDLISENQQLKQENEYLKAELDYLKKLDALIRAEEQKKNKNH